MFHVIAVAVKQVYVALFSGIWIGATFCAEYNLPLAFLRVADTYRVGAFLSRDHVCVICITFLLGGLIGLVQKAGGGLGLAELVTRFATDERRAELACVGLGALIFFDDYCSILIVGNSLRSIMRQVHVPVETFAFIVHSVGVCISCWCPISSWVGVQVGYISSSYAVAGIEVDPFMEFLRTIPLRFFPIMMLVMVIVVVVSQRNWGELYKVEYHAYRSQHSFGIDESGKEGEADGSDMLARPDIPRRWYNAVIPFGVVVGATFVGMCLSGYYAIMDMPVHMRPPMSLVHIFTHTDSLKALIWASLLGSAIGIFMVTAQRIFTIHDALGSYLWGIKEVIEPTIVMILAWGLGQVLGDLQTGAYLSSVVGAHIPPCWLPTLCLAVTYVMSFATGSAYGTMGILMPLVIPVVTSLTPSPDIRLQCTAAILGGAAFGNVASPIADDSILTAIAVKIDLSRHLSTHLPYVLFVAATTILLGTLPLVSPNTPLWLPLLLQFAAIVLVHYALALDPRHLEAPHPKRRWEGTVWGRLSKALCRYNPFGRCCGGQEDTRPRVLLPTEGRNAGDPLLGPHPRSYSED